MQQTISLDKPTRFSWHNFSSFMLSIVGHDSNVVMSGDFNHIIPVYEKMMMGETLMILQVLHYREQQTLKGGISTTTNNYPTLISK